MKAKYRSKFERRVGNILRRNRIKFKQEVKFHDLRGVGNGLLKFDFMVRKGRKFLFIEVDGRQHRVPVRFGGMTLKKAKKQFKITKIHDMRKNRYCKKHGFKLLRLNTDKVKDFNKLIKQFLKQS